MIWIDPIIRGIDGIESYHCSDNRHIVDRGSDESDNKADNEPPRRLRDRRLS
jgi:hypothetical protein